MSAEPRHSPWGIASIALIAGLLQIVASIALGMARLDAFVAASREPAFPYMIVALLIAAAVGSVWLVRERAPVAVAVALAWPLALVYGLRGRISLLGLAYHGEFILHHFAAALCLVLAITVPIGWSRDARLGRLRLVPMLLTLPGAVMLMVAHIGTLSPNPGMLGSPWLSIVGGALLLLAWPIATGLFWPQLGPPSRRPIALILMLPVLVRLGFTGPRGLAGELVPDAAIPWVGGAIVVTAITTLLLLRPRLERWVLVVVGLICLLGSMFFYYLYQQGFGDLEDGLGGLLQSLFGFQVPYPSYVDDVKSAALMMGLFFLFVTVYASLVSADDRVRGLALGLLAIAGLGFSSPHLVLMAGAGTLLFVETLLPGAPYRELDQSAFERSFDDLDDDTEHDAEPSTRRTRPSLPDAAALQACFESLAERLPGLDAPTYVEMDDGAMLALRGSVDSVAVDVRARVARSGVRIELSVGVIGLDDPVFELVPDSGGRGQRPAHLLSRSHRVSGELRSLERLGDGLLDAMTSFPHAYLRAWEAGMELELGRDLAGLRVDSLEALVRALARAVR